MSGSKTIAVAFTLAASLAAIFIACERESPLGLGEARLTISGEITLNGSPAGSVEVNLIGEEEGTTFTDSVGNYAFSDLDNGLYAIRPVRSGVVFNPEDLEVRLSGANLTDQNFKMLQLAPRLVVQKDKIDFGAVNIGDTREVDLGLSNLGMDQLTASQFSFSNSVFSGPTAELIILPDSLVYVTINFSPNSTALATGTLDITSNDPNTPTKTIDLSGRGIGKGWCSCPV